MWKRRVRIFCIVLGILAALGSAVYGALRYYDSHYVFLEGESIPRNVRTLDCSNRTLPDIRMLGELTEMKTLDLRGTGLTTADYDYLHGRLPQCDIRWEIPFQGRTYPQDTESLTVKSLSGEDMRTLAYFRQLKTLHGGECRDYEAMLTLMEQRPDLTVEYCVPLGQLNVASTARSVLVSDGSAGALSGALAELPNMEEVHLTGVLPTPEELRALQEKFPKVAFTWDVSIGGTVLSRETREAALSGNVTAQELSRLPDYLPELQKLDLTRVNTAQSVLAEFAKSHPEIECLYTVTVAGEPFLTDCTEMDLTGHKLSGTQELEELLPCFPKLQKLILCGCGLKIPELDDLDNRLPNIRVIWNVNIGGMILRTDAKTFMPILYRVIVQNEDLTALKYCKDLECVDLGHMYISDISWAKDMQKLRFLLLADTQVCDLTPLEGHTSLEYLELFLTKVQDVSVLPTLTGLKDLNLAYVYADPTPIREMTWLKRLWWPGNWNAENLLSGELPDTEKNFTSRSSTGEGWRDGELYHEMRDMLGLHYMQG